MKVCGNFPDLFRKIPWKFLKCSWNCPGIFPEISWKFPGNFLQISWKLGRPEMSRKFSRIFLEAFHKIALGRKAASGNKLNASYILYCILFYYIIFFPMILQYLVYYIILYYFNMCYCVRQPAECRQFPKGRNKAGK